MSYLQKVSFYFICLFFASCTAFSPKTTPIQNNKTKPDLSKQGKVVYNEQTGKYETIYETDKVIVDGNKTENNQFPKEKPKDVPVKTEPKKRKTM